MRSWILISAIVLGPWPSGQREDRRLPQVGSGLAQLQVFGAKVMSPLADAVGFVHDEQINGLSAQLRLNCGSDIRSGVV